MEISEKSHSKKRSKKKSDKNSNLGNAELHGTNAVNLHSDEKYIL